MESTGTEKPTLRNECAVWIKEGLLLSYYFLCCYCAQSHRIFTHGKISTEPLSLSDNARFPFECNKIRHERAKHSTIEEIQCLFQSLSYPLQALHC